MQVEKCAREALELFWVAIERGVVIVYIYRAIMIFTELYTKGMSYMREEYLMASSSAC